MTHPEQIVALAIEAKRIENRPADAAALLIDAAAFLSVEAKMPLPELTNRLENSREIFAEVDTAFALTGNAAARKQ